MNPEVWGPHLWFVLHTLSFNYPYEPTEDDKKKMINFIHALSEIIPCGKCQRHFKQNLEKLPIEQHLENKKQFVEWVIQMHNFVNEANGKRIYSYDEVIQLYLNYYMKNQYKKYMKWGVSIVVIVIFIYFIMKKKN
jgi:FAD-linked sulfhydryl oxidase